MTVIKQLKMLFLAVSHDQVDNNGKNQARFILPVLEKYSLKKKLSYIITDNARSKDICMTEIIEILRSNLDAHGEQLQYMRYIIYLAAKAPWFDDKSEIFEAKLAFA